MNSTKLALVIAGLTIAVAVGTYLGTKHTNVKLPAQDSLGQNPDQVQPDRSSAEEKALDNARKAVKEVAIAKMNFAKDWAKAFQSYAQDNGGKMAETFEQAAKYLPTNAQPATTSVSIDDFEIVFKGSLENIEQPDRIMIIREKRPFNVQPSGKASKSYSFADGHSEVHMAPDGNFEAWEQERMVSVAK